MINKKLKSKTASAPKPRAKSKRNSFSVSVSLRNQALSDSPRNTELSGKRVRTEQLDCSSVLNLWAEAKGGRDDSVKNQKD